MDAKILKPILWLVVFVMLVSLACMGPSGASQSSPVPPTEAPSQPTPVPPTEAVVAPSPTPEPASSAVNSLQDVKSAVIQIESQGTFIDPEFGLVLNGAGRGSGFIIDPSGIAVTNNHVVTGSALLKVWVGGDSEPHNARVLGVSECSDLAVIDIDGDGYPYLDWFSGPIDVGMDIYVAGFPLGDPEFTLTKGVISKAKANGETSWASVDSVIEYDASSNPGNSGGPVIDPNGQVLGVHYAGNATTRQAYGISRDIAAGVIDTLKTGKDVDTIGVNGQAVGTEDGSLTGVWVSSVKSGSPADRAGIQSGDIITMMENLVLATDGTMSDYCDILRSHQPTDTLSVEVLRWANGEVLDGQLNGRALEVSTTFGTGDNGNDGSSSTGTETINPNASASGDIYYSTDFDGGLGDWLYFLTNGSDDGFVAQTVNSNLKFQIDQQNTWVYFYNDAVSMADVRVDTVASNLGRNNNNVSLLCRYSDAGWYEFNIANNGEYTILYFDSSINDYRLLFSGGSTLIKMGKDVNEYTAVCNGDKLTLGINGVEVRTVTDKNLKSGYAGLSVSSFNVTPIDVEFDYFILSVP
jgi:S1-C subfamily serine protease